MTTKTVTSEAAVGRNTPSSSRSLLLALLVLTALLIPLEIWLNVSWHQLEGQNVTKYLAALDRPNNQSKVLIFGDSHPNNAFQYGNLPDSVVNVAFGSESLRDIRLKITTLLRRGVKPRCIVLQVDDHVFSPYRELTNNEQSVVLAANVDDYNQVYGRSLSPLKQWGEQVYPLSDLRNRNLLVSLLIEKYLHGGQAAGAVKPVGDQTWAQMPAEARVRIAENRLHDQFGDSFTLSRTMHDTWAEIVKLCRQQGIMVVGVRYPITDEYRTRLPRYDFSGVTATVRELAPDTVLDYSALYTGQGQYFQDSDHLSRAGAMVFVPRFTADLSQALANFKRR